jgi:hypothetical protein
MTTMKGQWHGMQLHRTCKVRHVQWPECNKISKRLVSYQLLHPMHSSEPRCKQHT